jgi:heme exporter protein A
MVQLQANNIGKRFGKRVLFRKMTVQFEGGTATAITGINGSGKSTLIRILAGVLAPGKGTITLTVDGASVDSEYHPFHVGLVAPYLNLYEDFSPAENLQFLARARGTDKPAQRIDELMRRIGLPTRINDPISTFSSGMKQRIRIATALFGDPDVLLLDEPGSNLDEAGLDLVSSIITEATERGKVVIVATNDEREASLCSTRVFLGDYA